MKIRARPRRAGYLLCHKYAKNLKVETESAKRRLLSKTHVINNRAGKECTIIRTIVKMKHPSKSGSHMRTNPFFILILCFFSFFWPINFVSAKTLHAVLVADTVHDNIRSITQPDLVRWRNELKIIARHTNMILKERVFSGSDFNKERIRSYLEDMRVENLDAVIFYFSGHGYRTFQKKTPWPFLTFEFYQPGLDIQWITNTIRKKKPQFALVMSDCCNNYMEYGLLSNETKNVVVKLKQSLPQYSGYKQLFCNAKGLIVVSSCSEGQFSYGSHMGGLYTQCFFNSLSRELQEKKPSWKNLLQRANGFIKHIQLPICEVYR